MSQLSLISRWVVRLFGYDGLLPAIVFALPGLLVVVFGPGVVMELTAVVLPIVAFFYRAAVGLQQIESNSCRTGFRRMQKAALLFALLILLLVDAFVILLWVMPPVALSPDDYLFAIGLYLVYLSLMAIASFPGQGRRIEPIQPSTCRISE